MFIQMDFYGIWGVNLIFFVNVFIIILNLNNPELIKDINIAMLRNSSWGECTDTAMVSL